MEEFVSFFESFWSRNRKLPICGDFNYWVDNPSQKPYSPEFMELLNINNFENHLVRPIHATGRTLDLVLLPVDSHVDDFKVLPVSSIISDYDVVFFHVNFPKAYSLTKSITF